MDLSWMEWIRLSIWLELKIWWALSREQQLSLVHTRATNFQEFSLTSCNCRKLTTFLFQGNPHQVQANASVTHYTAVPLLGDYVAAAASGAQAQNVLLSNSNVLPTAHNMNWSHWLHNLFHRHVISPLGSFRRDIIACKHFKIVLHGGCFFQFFSESDNAIIILQYLHILLKCYVLVIVYVAT